MAISGSPVPADAVSVAPLLEIVAPVHNEGAVLARSVGRLTRYQAQGFPFTWRITIVDNASTDGTWIEASKLAALHDHVGARRLDAKGRGRALRAAWSQSDAAIVAYMDVDLSTDLRALLPLVAPLVSGHSDVTIGSRLASGARVVRGDLAARSCHAPTTGCSASSSATGSATPSAASRLSAPTWPGGCCRGSPTRAGSSTPNCCCWPSATASASPRSLSIGSTTPTAGCTWSAPPLTTSAGSAGSRSPSGPAGPTSTSPASNAAPCPPGSSGELVSFAIVGVVSTAAYFALFLALRRALGAYGANAVALTATMVANTAAHRAWTFGRRAGAGRRRRREWARAVAVHLAGLALATGAIAAAGAVDDATTPSLVVLLLVASALGTALRFLLMPAWVFRKAEPTWSPSP